MPQITAIRRNVKNTSRCSVYVDDEFFAACPIDVALSLGLAKGMEMTASLEHTLRAEDRRIVLRQKLYRFATYKPRTEEQVVRHLQKLEATPEEITDVLAWLQDFHLVDDRAYVQRFIEAAHHQKPLSPSDARRRLRAKGIADELITAVLTETDQDGWVQGAVRTVAEKKLRVLSGTTAERQRKLIQFLQYRGFSWEAIRSVVRDLLPIVLAYMLVPVFLSAQEGSCEKHRLSEAINRFQPTTIPVLGPDGRLYVDRKLHPDNSGGITDPDEVWSAARRSAVVWDEPQRLPLTGPGIAQPDVLFNFTPDGLHAMVVGPYDSSGQVPRLAFALLHRRAAVELFAQVEVLPIPLRGDNYYAFLAADREVCFVAQQDDSASSMDIVIYSLMDGTVGGLPIPINTDGLEGAPWLAPDSRTLYLASNGRTDRRGKADLYVSRRQGNDWFKWTEPQQLGWCINSQEDEVAFSLLPGDTSAYITSWDPVEDRPGIYQVTLPDSVRPLPYLVLDVVAVNDLTGVAIADVQMQSGRSTWVSDTAERRIRATLAEAAVPRRLVVSASGYDTAWVELASTDLRSTVWYTDTVHLFPSGLPIASLYFDRGSDVITAEGQATLQHLLSTFRRLADTVDVQLEIDGFADAIGGAALNAELSERRARAVAEMMQMLGFPEDRCSVAGRGIDRSRRVVDPEGRRVDIYPRRR